MSCIEEQVAAKQFLIFLNTLISLFRCFFLGLDIPALQRFDVLAGIDISLSLNR